MTNFLQPLINCFTGKANETPVHVAKKTPSIPNSPKRVRKVLPSRQTSATPDTPEGLVRQLKSAGRYAVLLMPQITSNLRMGQLVEVVELLGCEMSRIPSGPVSVEFQYLSERPSSTSQIHETDSFLLDRFAVTNAEYKLFVDEGCYESKELWDPTIAPALNLFVDETGKPGPSGWKNGNIPKGKASHPVVGISWHEASAYARWVGKRLPTRIEWVKAASWPLASEGKPTRQRAFPWGNAFDDSSMNVWATGLHCTVPVDEFQNGNSASDVCQMCGNVWEWIADDFQIFSADTLVSPEDSIKALRGGAFDTYIERQAACQFESGDNSFARKCNIGFRCATSAADFAPEVQELVERLTDLPRPTTLVSDEVPEEEDGSAEAPITSAEQTRKEKARRAKEVVEDRLKKWTTSIKRGAEAMKDNANKDGAKKANAKKSSKAKKPLSDKSDAKDNDKDDNKPYKSPFAGPGF